MPVGGGQFAVLYSVLTPKHVSMRYALVSSAGRVLARRTWKGKEYNAMGQPVLVGHKLLWVGANMTSRTDANGYYLYGLNVRNPATPSLLRR